MAVTVVLAATVIPSAVETVVTVAPVRPAVEGSPVIVEPERTPLRQIVGNARVPDVPLKVSHVVPAGTLALLIAVPVAMPVPETTDAEPDAAVVVSDVFTEAQIETLNGP
jgi:hypothetical protein